ncbi:MAG: endonuclease NucS domain-containing protein [Dehalococcoidia bacterium]
MATCHQAIREAMREAGTALRAEDIIGRVYRKYPNRPWEESTIHAHLYAASVNHPPAYTQHPSARKFLFDLGERACELYDPEKHGRWTRGYREGEGRVELVEDQQVLIQASITLEKDLQEYIVRNLDQTEPDLKLYSKGGISGREFATDVGKIDILATDKGGNFAIVEVKAGRASDATASQILGYMNSIRRNIAAGKR